MSKIALSPEFTTLICQYLNYNWGIQRGGCNSLVPVSVTSHYCSPRVSDDLTLCVCVCVCLCYLKHRESLALPVGS